MIIPKSHKSANILKNGQIKKLLELEKHVQKIKKDIKAIIYIR